MSVDRRDFLKVAAGGAAALASNLNAAEPPAATPQEPQGGASNAEVLTTDKPGADFLTDAFKSLNLEYVAAVPGSSFRGCHESLINYGGNKNPEWLTVTARGNLGGHGAWLCQVGRQAHGGLSA